MINKSLPPKIEKLFKTKKRFVILRGGRGSAKSWSTALYLVVRACRERTRILCTREVQNSIKDSVHKLLSDIIGDLQLNYFFDIKNDSIKGSNGSEFIFKGLWNNEDSIKSTEGIDICWVEEAQAASAISLEYLFPTIRKNDSQILFTYNPTFTDDPIHMMSLAAGTRDSIELIEINYSDNQYFPDVLREEMEWDKKTNYDLYLHKWAGKCKAASDAQIFKGKYEVKEFEIPKKVEWYYGADWGSLTGDPSVLNRSFVQDRCLYIADEVAGNWSLDNHVVEFDKVPESRQHKIIADSARPETIEFLNSRGFFIVPAAKGKGSIDDGIERLKNFEMIYIHPSCTNMINEMRLYCYKQDKRSGKISTVPEDSNNHSIDALRYATEKYVKPNHVGNFLAAFANY